MPSESETVYDRIAKLEDEVAALRSEIDFLKHALRNELDVMKSKWQGKALKYLPL